MSRIDRIAEPWGTRTPYAAGQDWPVRVDMYLQDGLEPQDVDRWVQTDVALLLLRDLREVYMKASGVSADWEMLAQTAQGIKHTDLLAVAQKCHPETLHQMHWANAKLKESSTQILIS